MRDGLPLPGLTADAVVSQLTHRVFGPLRITQVRSVLDYHGLNGRPAAPTTEIAQRHQITAATVNNRVRKIQDAGARLPLDSRIIRDATRISSAGDDHRGRVRIATTLGLPSPHSRRR